VQHGSRSRNLQTQGYPERFLTCSTARGTGHEGRRSRQPYWKGAGLFFFVLVSNHYFSIVLFLWSSSTYNTHTSIKAAKIVTLKPFPSSTNFDSDLRLMLISTTLQSQLLQITLQILLENICNTNHESISR